MGGFAQQFARWFLSKNVFNSVIVREEVRGIRLPMLECLSSKEMRRKGNVITWPYVNWSTLRGRAICGTFLRKYASNFSSEISCLEMKCQCWDAASGYYLTLPTRSFEVSSSPIVVDWGVDSAGEHRTSLRTPLGPGYRANGLGDSISGVAKVCKLHDLIHF